LLRTRSEVFQAFTRRWTDIFGICAEVSCISPLGPAARRKKASGRENKQEKKSAASDESRPLGAPRRLPLSSGSGSAKGSRQCRAGSARGRRTPEPRSRIAPGAVWTPCSVVNNRQDHRVSSMFEEAPPTAGCPQAYWARAVCRGDWRRWVPPLR
jgi:hypothetical protein